MKKIINLFSILLISTLVGCNPKTSENTTVSIKIDSTNNGEIITPDKVTISETFNTIEDKRQFNTQTLPSIGDVNLLVIPVIIPGFESIDIDGDGNDDLDRVKDDLNEAFLVKEKIIMNLFLLIIKNLVMANLIYMELLLIGILLKMIKA